MSPLRMPQHLADAPHVGTGEARLKFELLEEIDAGLRRCEQRIETALRELREHPEPEGRGPLVDAAADAVWELIVQHEANDCCDHSALIERYRIPPEVMARVGARH